MITMWFGSSCTYEVKLVTAFHFSDGVVSICLRRETGHVINGLHIELFGSVRKTSVFLALLLALHDLF